MSKQSTPPAITGETGLLIGLGVTGLIAILVYNLPDFNSPYLLVLLLGGLFSAVLFVLMQVTQDRLLHAHASANLSEQEKQQQATYQAVIEQAREVLFQISANGNWLFLNPEWERLTGFSAAESLGKSFIDYVHSDDRPGCREIFRSLTEGERDRCHRMVRWLTQSGEFRWVDIYARPTLDKKGAVVSIEGSFIDVTQRVKAVDALQASEEKYRLLCHTTTDTIVMMDKAGRIDYANPAATALFGYTTEQLLGKNISMLQPERVREAHRRGMERYLQQGVRTLDWRSTKTNGLHAEGHELPIEVAFNHSYIGDREVFIGFMRDLSQRQQADQLLHLSEERFALALKGSQAAIWDWNIVTNEVYYSPRWKEIIGYSEGEIGQDPEEFQSRLHPDDREAVIRTGIEHFKSHTPYQHEYRLRSKEGDYRWVRALGDTIRDAQGRSIRMIGAVMEISERKNSELKLQESNVKLATSLQSLEIRANELSQLRELSSELQACVTLEQAHQVVVRYAKKLFQADAGGVFLFNAAGDQLEPAVVWGDIAAEDQVYPPDACSELRAKKLNQPAPTHWLPCQHVHGVAPEHYLCTPLISQGETLGALHLRSAQPLMEKVGFAQFVSEHIGLALVNIKLQEKLREQSVRDPLTG